MKLSFTELAHITGITLGDLRYKHTATCLNCKRIFRGKAERKFCCRDCWLDWQRKSGDNGLIKNLLPITDTQKQIIFGSLLGDSWLEHNPNAWNSHYRVACTHSLQQSAYLYFKYEYLQNLCPAPPRLKRKHGQVIGVIFNTCSHPSFDDIASLITKPGLNLKWITSKWLNEIGELGLAIWYMDDGSCSGNASCRIHTEGFSETENYLLSGWLAGRFGISAKVKFYKNSYYYLSLAGSERDRLFDLIRPYIPNCMNYKLLPPVTPQICAVCHQFFQPSRQYMAVVTALKRQFICPDCKAINRRRITRDWIRKKRNEAVLCR